MFVGHLMVNFYAPVDKTILSLFGDSEEESLQDVLAMHHGLNLSHSILSDVLICRIILEVLEMMANYAYGISLSKHYIDQELYELYFKIIDYKSVLRRKGTYSSSPENNLDHEVLGQKEVPIVQSSVRIKIHEDPGSCIHFCNDRIVTTDNKGRLKSWQKPSILNNCVSNSSLLI